MMKKIASIIFIASSLIVPQDDYISIMNSDKERYLKSIQLSEICYPGDSRIDVYYYGLKLKITSNPEYLSGSAIVGIKTDTSEINFCFLDLKNELSVDSVLLNGTSVLFTHGNKKINIILDRVYHQGETFTVEVFYQGVPGSTGFGSFVFGSHNGYPVIWTLSEPFGAPDWFPCKDTPGDKADSSDVWITAADNLTAISNGTLESVTNNGNGTKTFYWKNHNTIAHYLISLAVSNYYQYNTYFHYAQSDSMVITNFIYPEDFTTVKNVVDETDDMIEAFSSRYGMYPFINEKYGHAETGQGGAMEHQTCTSLGLSAFNTRTVSHELAHQWYGDMITCRDWHHVWLNEGFATYSAAVYIEASDGKAAYDTYIVSEMGLARLAQGTIWVEDITDINEIFDWNRSYKKAGCVLHMLRGIVGDSVFFNIMRAYSDDPALKWGTAVTEDFQEIAENVYGQDLDYFFQEWIYGENYPQYTILWNKSSAGGNIYQVSLNISQVSNSNPSYFTMPVQVKINTSLGDTTVTLFNNAQTQYFQFDIYGDPESVEFDPGNWILKTAVIITEVRDQEIPLNYSLNQNYPNPFNPATTIRFEIPVRSFVSLKVYDLLGNEVTSLISEEKPAGAYEVQFDGSELTSGVYFYRIQALSIGRQAIPDGRQAGNFIDTKRMVLMK